MGMECLSFEVERYMKESNKAFKRVWYLENHRDTKKKIGNGKA